MIDPIKDAENKLNSVLRPFVPEQQRQILKMMLHASDSMNAAEAVVIVNELSSIIEKMPKTYETDGQGRKAKAFLHYFYGSYDAYVIERDVEECQKQAFGWASFGYGFEAGYLNLEEVSKYAELDFYFEPEAIENLF